MYSLFCVCVCIYVCVYVFIPIVFRSHSLQLPSFCPTVCAYVSPCVQNCIKQHFTTSKHANYLLLLVYRDCLLCWGTVYTSMHEGAASLHWYLREVKIKKLLSSLLLPLGLFVSLQPRLNQFWVGSHADIQKIRLWTNEQSSYQLLFQENREQAEWWEDRLMDGWRRWKSLETKRVQRWRKYEETVTLKKEAVSVFWCLTLPEGRLQFSRAVSTRFLSAENILKILWRYKYTPLWAIAESPTQTEGVSLWSPVSNWWIHHSF